MGSSSFFSQGPNVYAQVDPIALHNFVEEAQEAADAATIAQGSALAHAAAAAASAIAATAATSFTQAGTGAVSRTLQAKLREHVNVVDFDVDMTGATDSATKLTNALTAAAASTGVLTVPAGIVRLDSTVNIPPGVTLRGAGMPGPHAYGDGGYPSSASPGNATWFFFNHSDVGFYILTDWTVGNSIGQGSRHLKHFGTFRLQPTPGSGAYTPADHSWDFMVLASNEVSLSDIMLMNASRGIYVGGSDPDAHGTGRVDMHRIFGQPLKVGIHVEYMYDVARINQIHFWPFWSTNANVMTYTHDNAYAMKLGRTDNLQVDEFFNFSYHIGCYIYNSPTIGTLAGGTTGNGQFGLFQCDAVDIGLFVDAGANGAKFAFDQFITFGGNGLTNNPRAFWIAGDNSLIRIGDFFSVASGSRHGAISGSGNNVRIGCLSTTVSDYNATGLAQFDVGAGNHLHIDSEPVTDALIDKLVSGAGSASGNFWRSYTPAVTAWSGTLTATADARYRRIGETVDVMFNIDTSNNGTAATAVLFSLPVTSHADFNYPLTIGAAREMAVSAKLCSVWIASSGATNAIISGYDNSYPGGTGTKLTGTIRYRCAA